MGVQRRPRSGSFATGERAKVFARESAEFAAAARQAARIHPGDVQLAARPGQPGADILARPVKGVWGQRNDCLER
jgi:hypothetical protein